MLLAILICFLDWILRDWTDPDLEPEFLEPVELEHLIFDPVFFQLPVLDNGAVLPVHRRLWDFERQ